MTLYYIAWFIAALVLVIVEMNLMSFYLMALALGAAAGGIAAYLEMPLQEQCIAAGIVTMLAACGSFYLRRKLKHHMDKDNNELDRGQRVVVKADNIREDGTALVNYRGTEWVAYKEKSIVTPGIYFIARVDGTKLVLGDQLEQPNISTAQSNATAPSSESDVQSQPSNTAIPAEKKQDSSQQF